MDTQNTSASGFSLIELVATLVLVGLLAAGGFSLAVYVVHGFGLAREHAELAASIELAMARLLREARDAEVVQVAGNVITFTREGDDRVFARDGTDLEMTFDESAYPLMRNVTDFVVQDTAVGGGQMLEFTITPGAGPIYTGRMFRP